MSADSSQMSFDSSGLDTNWLDSLNNSISSDPNLSTDTMDLSSQNDASLGSNGYGLWDSQGGGSWASLTTDPNVGPGSGGGGDWMSNLASIASGLRGGGGGGGGGNGSWLNSILGLASGAYGLNQANALKSLASQAISASNPFGPYRAQYAQQLSALAANPNSIFQDPGYQAAFGQGSQAVARRMAGSGYAGSGNEAIALQQYGTDFANQYLMQRMNQLAGLAGANITPNPGPGLSTYTAGVDQAGASLGSLGYGASMAQAAAGGGSGGGFNSAGGEAATIAGDASLARSIANLAGNFTGNATFGEAGNAAGIVGGLARGGVTGYGSAAVNAAQLGQRSGYLNGPTATTATNELGGALQLYSGIKQGGVVGDTEAGVGAARMATSAGLLGGTTGMLAKVAGYAAIPLALYQFYETGTKSGKTGSDVESGAMSGAEIGSMFGPIGTVVGGVIGAAAGGVASAFGPGAMDPENLNWDSYAAAYDKNPQAVSGASASQNFQALAGIFDSRGSKIPFYSKYGRMGENQFMVGMTQKINDALASGKISSTATPQQIYQTVVQPWVSSMSPTGWQQTYTAKGAAEQNAVGGLLTNLIGQWQNNQLTSYSSVGVDGQNINGLPTFGNRPLPPRPPTGKLTNVQGQINSFARTAAVGRM